MKKRILLLCVALLSLNYVFSQVKSITHLYDAGAMVKERIVDITHLKANLKIDPLKQRIEANVRFDFYPFHSKTDSVVFSIGDFKVNAIRIGKQDCRYRIDGGNLVVYPSSKLIRLMNYIIEIDYFTMPAQGIYFIGWDDPKGIKRKQVWAQRPYGWLPVIETRLTVDMSITFDKNFMVFFNGERKSIKENKDGTTTWNYIMTKPHPFFSTALVIGEYKYKKSITSKGIPLELCYYPGMENKLEVTYRYTEKMFDFFETEMGMAYPYPVYRELPVIDYMYGAMETTTSTIYADFLLTDKRESFSRNFININAHELAHQWFGNCISHLADKDVWLTESFGTYYAKIFERSVFGDDYFQNERNNELQKVLTAALKDNFPVAHSEGLSDRWYSKGSLVLDMLRYVIGDDEFKEAVKYYLKNNQFKSTETTDFFRAVRESTGNSPDWFYDEWILRGGEPHYKVSWKSHTDSNGVDIASIYVSQIHPVSNLIGYFKMPVVVEVHYTDGSVDSRKTWIEDQFHEISIPDIKGRKVAFVLFDPNRQIIKKLTFERPLSELINQATMAGNMIDRYDAIVALKDFPLEMKKYGLWKIYQKESFHLIKSEIISQLAQDSSPTTLEIFRKALSDPDFQVRKTMVKYVVHIPVSIKPDYEALLIDSAYNITEIALENLCKSFPEKTDAYLETTKEVKGWRGLNVWIKWLEIAISSGKKEFIPELNDYTSISFEFETRINAMNALKRLNYLDEQEIKNIFLACFHWNFKLSNAAKSIIEYYSQQNVYKDMLLKELNSGFWTNNEKDLIRKNFK